MGVASRLRDLSRNPAARRVAAVVLVAGLALIVVRLLAQNPVDSSVVVVLEGEWPAVNGVTLSYSRAGGGEALREVRLVGGHGGDGRFGDEVSLSPGRYLVRIRVDTARGPRTFERELDHSSGAVSRVPLRY